MYHTLTVESWAFWTAIGERPERKEARTTTQIDTEMIKMVVNDAVSFMVALTNYIDQPARMTSGRTR